MSRMLFVLTLCLLLLVPVFLVHEKGSSEKDHPYIFVGDVELFSAKPPTAPAKVAIEPAKPAAEPPKAIAAEPPKPT
jgi:hypothetical protein